MLFQYDLRIWKRLKIQNFLANAKKNCLVKFEFMEHVLK